MSRQVWDYIAFSITILIAAFAWWLAWLTYSRNRQSYLHRTLALTLLFAGLWISSGWVEKIFSQPPDSFTAFTYRWAYVSWIIAVTFYVLFALAMYIGRKPSPKYSVPILATGGACALMAATPLVIRSASYQHGDSFLHPGPLHFLAIGFLALALLAIIGLNTAKFLSSTGIERAQSSIRLLAWGILLTLVPTLAFIIPSITGSQATAQYAFFVALFPLCLDFYAIMRLRYLDIRIILRKAGLYMLIAIVFSLPVLLAYIVFSAFHFQLWQERLSLLLLILALALSAPLVLKRAVSFSSRHFFSDVYDEAELLQRINSILLSESSLPDTLLSVISQIAASLALTKAQIVVLRTRAHSGNWLFGIAEEEGKQDKRLVERDYEMPRMIETIDEPFIMEEQARWPESESKRKTAEGLETLGFSSCFPLKTDQRMLGFLMSGKKINCASLTSTDISFLQQVADYLSIFIEKYSMAASLAFQLKELEQVHRELQQADLFKKEIIDVTAHELKTPLTILSSFVFILSKRYDEASAAEREEYLRYIKDACERLSMTINQFVMVSNLQENEFLDLQPIELNQLLSEIIDGFDEPASSRIRYEQFPSKVTVRADHFYLSLMLKNIIANAIRFSPDEKPIILSGNVSGKLAEISIQDFGDGIEPSDARLIFDPFTRLEDLDHHQVGTGLGLYAVRLIADLLGTKIEVEQGPDGGTIFSCQLEINAES